MTISQVLCFGEVLFDRMPGKVAGETQDYVGGAPANVALGLSKLGTPAAFLGRVGADAAGQELTAQLQDNGVDVSGLQSDVNAPTRVVEVIQEQGDRKFLGFVGGEDPASFADAQLLAEELPEALFAEADYLLLGTIPLAYPNSATALERALELADQACVKLFLDVNWRPMFWAEPESAKAKIEALMTRVDFLKLSESEAQWLFGTTDAAAILAQLDQLEGVFVTAAERGSSYAMLAGPQGQEPAFKMPVLDTTGAGDAFVAGLLHYLTHNSLQKLSDGDFVAEMLRYGNAAGSLAVTGMGAIAPQATDAEIQAFLVGRVS